MNGVISFGMCVLAVTVASTVGCGDSSDGETGGSGGTGGSAGMGGGGSGGVSSRSSGLWTGEGTWGAGGTGGAGMPWTVCFTVNEAGTALTADPFDCQGQAILVVFDGCGQLRVRNDVPIVDGSFEVNALDNVIVGTFDSATMATGSFSANLETCTGQWDAMPAEP